MDIERCLISHIVKAGTLTEVTEAQITRAFFTDPGSQRVWDTIVGYHTDHGQVPTQQVIGMEHPDYRLLRTAEPVSYLIDRLRQARSKIIIDQALAATVMASDVGDTDAAARHMAAALTQLAREIPAARDVDFTSAPALAAFLDRYREAKQLEGGLRGVPTGFASLDAATQGWQPGHLVTIIGIPKSGKSTVLLLSAKATSTHGKVPLFVGFEMSNEEQQERLVAFWAGLDHNRLRAGELTRPEERRLEKTLRALESMPPFHFSADSMSATTVTGVAEKIDRLRPDVAFIDGVYMMDDENGEPKGSPQALTNITRSLKRLAQNSGIPIVGTTQALESKLGRGRSLSSYSVGYTSSFAQDSDYLLGAEQTDDPGIQRIRLLIGRNARPLDTYIEWDWTRGRFAELDHNPFSASDDDYATATAAGF